MLSTIPDVCMGGGASIQDIRHRVTFTMTGTPTTHTLLGANAPVFGASAYTSCKFDSADIDIAPGSDFTFVGLIHVTWPYNDGNYHRLFWTWDGADNYVAVEKDNFWNELRVLYHSATGDKKMAVELNADNWAAGDHLIIARLESDGSLALWLDGTKYWINPIGSGPRETAWGTNVCFGGDDQNPGIDLLDGYGLFALYGRAIEDSEADEINTGFGYTLETSWTDTKLLNSVAMDVYGLVADGAGNVYAGGALNSINPGAGVWKYDGTTWTDIGMSAYWIEALGYDPVNNLLYAGTQTDGVWVYDGAWTYTGFAFETVRFLHVAAHNAIYAGTVFHGVWKYDGSTWTDTGLVYDGTSWTDIPGLSVGDIIPYVDGLTYDTTHDLLYACANDNGVWVYDGATWTCTGGINHRDIEDVVYDDFRDVVYLATDTHGVMQYDGATWTTTEPWLDSHLWYQMYSLAYDSASHYLYVGIHTQGVWRYDGATWTHVQEFTDSNFGLNRLCLDDSTLYVGYGTTYAPGTRGVWETDTSEITLLTGLWRSLYSSPSNISMKSSSHREYLYIVISDPRDNSTFSKLTEMIPDQAPGIDVFEGLTFESCNPGGFTVGNFTLHRKVTQYWPDLLHRAQVVIGEGAEVYWEGYIDKPIRKIRPDTFDVACQGWSAQLNQLWTTADITVSGAANNQCSDFITSVLLADSDIEIIAGTIETGDYAFPVNTKFEFAPATYYFDCIEQFNAANNCDWGVWVDKRLDFTAKTPSAIDWYVWTRDCEDLQIAPNPEALCNYVMVDFVQGGSYHEQVVLQDAASQLLYGVRKKKLDIPGLIDESSVGPANPGGATHIGNTYLADCKDLRVAAEFTCNRIFDSYGAEQPLGKVRGGDNVRLVDWMPTEELLTGVNDIATFQIKAAKYDHSKNTLDITPTEFMPRTDIMLARLQAVGY